MIPDTSSNAHDSRSDGIPALAAWYLCAWRARAGWLIPIWGGVVLFVLILMLRHTFYDAQAALRQSYRDVVALQPQAVADEENAAKVYGSFFLTPFAGPKSLEPSSIIALDSRLLERSEIGQHMQSNSTQMGLLHQALAMPRCNWGLDYSQGINMRLPHLAMTRAYARLLALETRLKAHAGDHAGAARNLGQMLTLADQVATDPILTCGLIATAIRSIAFNTMEAIIWWDPPERVADLRAYLQALGVSTEPSTLYIRMMETERRFGLYLADQMATQDASIFSVTGLPDAVPVLALFMGAERDSMDRVYKDMTAKRGEAMNEQELIRSLDRNRTGTGLLANLMIPVTAKIIIQLQRAEEQRRLTVLALAFLEYRVVHGRDPATLDVLTPEFLPELPVDATAGQPPRQRVDPAGILSQNPFKGGATLPRRGPGLTRLYFCGANKRDDTGLNTWSNEKDTAEADDPAIRIPPTDWKPDEWPTPEELGAPPLPVPSADQKDTRTGADSPGEGTGKNR